MVRRVTRQIRVTHLRCSILLSELPLSVELKFTYSNLLSIKYLRIGAFETHWKSFRTAIIY